MYLYSVTQSVERWSQDPKGRGFNFSAEGLNLHFL